MLQILDRIQLNRLWLVLADAVSVVLASMGWLLIRFDIFSVPLENLEQALIYLAPDVILTVAVFWVFRLYHSVWTYASLNEILNVFFAVLIITSLQLVFKELLLIGLLGHVPWSFYLLNPVLLFMFASFFRMSIRILRHYKRPSADVTKQKRTLLVGGGAAAFMLMNELAMNPSADNHVEAIVDDNPAKKGKYIHGIRIAGDRRQIPDLARKHKIEEIIIAIPSADSDSIAQIVEICYMTDCRVKILPFISRIVEGRLTQSLRDISYEDLLTRKPVVHELPGMRDVLQKRRILVTGGGGSIGSELCRQIAAYGPAQLLIMDISENGAYRLVRELNRNYPDLDARVLIGSVRDMARLEHIFETYKPELVYHAAAHKHVPLMEESPAEAIKNNCKGTWNLCQVADKYGVHSFLLVSTDKAVRPTNIMGASKRICEMILQYHARRSGTRFTAVRFGNVLGSDGSVVPLFLRQIEQGGPVTVTHEEITRFFMTIPEAVSLILETAQVARGGEIFVLDMGKQVRIYDMAEKLIRMKGLRPHIDIPIEITGLRPGEKLYEELLLAEEGTQKTANQHIFIASPMDFDEEDFPGRLENLIAAADRNQPDIKERAREICCNYTIADKGSREA